MRDGLELQGASSTIDALPVYPYAVIRSYAMTLRRKDTILTYTRSSLPLILKRFQMPFPCSESRPDAEFRISIGKIPEKSDFDFERMASDKDLSIMQRVLLFPNPYFIYHPLKPADIQALSKMTTHVIVKPVSSPGDGRVIAGDTITGEVLEIMDHGNEKRNKLRDVFYRGNPHLSYSDAFQYFFLNRVQNPRKRWFAGTNICCRCLDSILNNTLLVCLYTIPMTLAFFALWIFCSILTRLLDIVCYSAEARKAAHLEYISLKMNEHPELDTAAIDRAMIDELTVMCVKLSDVLGKRVVLWTGVEKVRMRRDETSNRARDTYEYNQDQFVVLINCNEEKNPMVEEVV
jgi:hypothetical protein